MSDNESSSSGLSGRAPVILICLALALGVLALYAPVHDFDFVNYDDTGYVTENALVQEGLTREGIIWAFCGTHLSNWHPLTTLSHLAACELWGLDGGKHHLINVGLHALNAVLLFLVLLRLTGARSASCMVAAFFAFHPIHVESVAWISERKDGLCMLFWLLCILAHVRFAERSTMGRRATLIGLFALGIMTKPMIVTLPCALLLLDVWPLNRVSPAGLSLPFGRGVGGALSAFWKAWKPLIVEKLPLFGLTLFLAAMTVRAQSESMMVELDRLPLFYRFGNSLVAYSLYPLKAIWPTGLAVFYPHPGQWPLLRIVAAAVFVFGVSWLAFKNLAKRPYIAVGWFWYLGTLVPVIGLVQVGEQAIADRYAYFTLPGLYIVLCWAVGDGLRRRPRLWPMAAALACLAVAACIKGSAMQIKHWRNSETLFRRAIAVTENNDVAHNNLAAALSAQGKLEEARPHLAASYQINPYNINLLNNLALLAEMDGDPEQAAVYYLAAVDVDPDQPDVRVKLGVLLARLNRSNDAAHHYAEALRLDPDHVDANYNLGNFVDARRARE